VWVNKYECVCVEKQIHVCVWWVCEYIRRIIQIQNTLKKTRARATHKQTNTPGYIQQQQQQKRHDTTQTH